jgi:preprotein translocase subunit SecA
MFFLSLEDDLMRLFGSDRIAGIMQKLGVEEGDVITHSMVTKAIDRAQKRVEAQNFSIRKHLLEYDNVMNSQREIIYELRNAALHSQNIRDRLFEMMDGVIDTLIEEFTESSGHPLDWDMEGLSAKYAMIFFTRFKLTEDQELILTQEAFADFLLDWTRKSYLQKASLVEPESLAWNERVILLSTIDELWKEHLYEMDQLKEGIGLRGYGQRDPLVEYKREGYLLFDATLTNINTTILKTLFRALSKVQYEIGAPDYAKHNPGTPREEFASRALNPSDVRREAVGVSAHHQTVESGPGGRAEQRQKTVRNTERKVGRNEPCPCGSGKKYKVCCGR